MTTARFRKIATIVVGIVFALSIGAVALSDHPARPAEISHADMAGAIFDRPDLIRTEHDYSTDGSGP